ncbi:MAG: calcium/sodium antiporter [Thermoplasmata archaeon]
MIEIPLFLLGLVMLVKASDYLVKSAATIAKLLGVSELLIGLTLVAIGTSIPEMATAVMASAIRENEIVSGNIVGACILNIGAVLGLSAMARRIRTNEDMLRRDGYIMILAMVLFLVFAYDLTVQRWEALILVVFYFTYVMFLFGSEHKDDGKKYHFKEFLIYFFKFGYLATLWDTMTNSTAPKKETRKSKARKKRIGRELAILAVSGVAVVLGAHFFINGALYFANLLGVSGTFIGITLVSIGTTLPEMTVSVTAAKKGFGNIAVGNVIGSNIANIMLIAGIAGLIFPLSIINLTVWYSAPFMIFMGLIVLVFIRTRWVIKKWEGALLFAFYLGFLAFLFLNPQ